ncbi:MAG: alpha/beta hydrolase, partial [Dermacoccus nishinomiyaensis]
MTVSRVQHGPSQARVTSISGPRGRDFVLVAGIGVASDYYVRLALDLNQVGTVHAIDLPGFGGVPHGKQTPGIEGFADLVEAAIT